MNLSAQAAAWGSHRSELHRNRASIRALQPVAEQIYDLGNKLFADREPTRIKCELGISHYRTVWLGAALWNASNNIKAWFDNLTTLFSTAMRTGGTVWNSTDSSLYTGTSLSTVGVYQVRWAWIAYPATILVVSIIFVALNIWRSSRQYIGSVKDSATALACVKLDKALEEMLIAGNGALHWASDFIGSERVQLLEENGFVLLKRIESLHRAGSNGDLEEDR